MTSRQDSICRRSVKMTQAHKKPHLGKILSAASYGGGGNRTRVPWYFSVGFYVCSLSSFDRPKPCGSAGRSPLGSPTSRMSARLTGL